MSISTVLSQIGKPATYYPSLARLFGSVNAAIFLCQFLSTRSEGSDGEVKTQSEIEEETGIGKEGQQTAVRILKDAGILTVVKKGSPPVNHYIFNWEELDRLWEQRNNGTKSEPIQSTGKPSINRRESRPLIDGNPSHQSTGKPSINGRESLPFSKEDAGAGACAGAQVGFDLLNQSQNQNQKQNQSQNISAAPQTEGTSIGPYGPSISTPSVSHPLAVRIPALQNVTPSVLTDFETLRRSKRAPITATGIAGIEREAAKAGITLEDALIICCERGWQSFKAEWHRNAQLSNNQSFNNNRRSIHDERAETIAILTGRSRRRTLDATAPYPARVDRDPF